MFIRAFSCFLRLPCNAMNFPLRMAFPMSHWFWIVISSFSLVSRYLLISFLIFLLTYSLFNNILFSFQVFACFSMFFLWLISSFIALWSEKMLDMISIFLNLLRLVLCPNMWSILENVPYALAKYILLFWGEMLWRYQLNPFDLVCHLRALSFCWHSVKKI